MRLGDLDDHEDSETLTAMKDAAIGAARARGVTVPELILIPVDPERKTIKLFATLAPDDVEQVIRVLVLQNFLGKSKDLVIGADGVCRTVPEHKASGVRARGDADGA